VSFKDIKGQDRAVSILKNAVENNRLSHAYIFWGPEGVGKKLTAVNFAKWLNCRGEVSGGPCDNCISCRKIDSSNHPDVFLFAPEKEGSSMVRLRPSTGSGQVRSEVEGRSPSTLSKAEGSIGIDKIRSVIKDIALKPYEAKKKIYIIDNAETLTREASNAFLKTLEEPTPVSVLILITQDLRDLMPTIISRGQAVKFYPLGTEQMKEILIKEYKVDEKLAQVLSHLSSGRLGAALRYRDESFLKKRARIINELCSNALFDSDFDGVSRADLRLYLDIMLTWYRDILITKAGTGAIINVDKKDVILNEARRMEFSYLDRVMKQVILTGSFLDINANPKLVMSVLGLAALENAG